MSMLVLQIFVLCALTTQLVLSQGPYKRVCYYTNWAQYRPNEGKFKPNDVDASLCTHLVFAFAKMKGNRLEAFEWNDESTDWMKGMYAQFNELKMKNPTMKTLLAVGGWNMASKPFTAMVATPASRREFATTSVQFLRERGFDGLDLDWEYPANRGSPPEDRARYAQLVSELRRTFDAEARRTGREPLLLTSAVAAGKDKIDTAYDIPSVCRDMDFISIMTYDLHGSWEDITGHNSPLFAHSGETGNQRYLNMDWAANYWVQNGCPKSKLIIGMGLYGRSFTLKDPYDNGLMAQVKGKGEAGKFTREGGFLAYYEICNMIKQGANTYYIKEQEAPYVVKGTQWVGYDDVDSLRIKVQWMKQNGFAGVMVWALDLDDFKGTMCGQGKYPLMNAINNELRGAIALPPKSRPNRVNADLALSPILPGANTNNNNNGAWNTNNDWGVSNTNTHTNTDWNTNTNNLNTDWNANTNPVNTDWNSNTNNLNNNNNNWQNPPPPTTAPPNLPHLTNEFKCPPNENTYFPSPDSCEDYFICASGLSFKFTCSPPLRWNSVNNFCDWPDNVPCTKKLPVKAPAVIIPKTRPTTTTTTTTTRRPTTTTTTPRPTTTRRPTTKKPRHIARPTFTQRPRPIFPTTQSPIAQPTPPWLDWSAWIAEFWKALTSMTGGPNTLMQQTMATAAEKATSQIFGTNAGPISPIQQFTQPEVASLCAGKLDGTHPDPTDCSKYVECVGGNEYPGACPAGTAYDEQFRVCDYKHNVKRCNVQAPQGW